MSELALPLRVAATGQRFYTGMAATCFAIAVIGFAPTFWIPLFRGTLDVTPITYVHALFFYSWTLLFWRQTALASSGRLIRHRELGVLSVAVATGMCFVGLGVAMNTLKRSDAAGFGEAARSFTIVPVTAVAFFAVLFAVALFYVKNAELHKRLMLVATVSLLQAAIGRWFALFLSPVPVTAGTVHPPPVFVTVAPGLVGDLLIVAAMIRDRRIRGQVHPAYWIAGGSLVALQILRVPLSTTPAWTKMTTWLIALAP